MHSLDHRDSDVVTYNNNDLNKRSSMRSKTSDL